MSENFILVTGGAGFIGANFVLDWAALETDRVVVLDNFSYAGNLQNLSQLREGTDYHLVRGDIGDRALVEGLLAQYQPRAVVHFAAESHVDRSIVDPGEFVQTNVVGTFNLLHATLAYWRGLDDTRRASFRFLQVSTDEVYGTLGPADPAFSETTPYAPNSPYAASKAAADHLVRAYFHTYGLPTLTTHCSNNYGPFQFPEKLIPLVILNALEGKPLPIYGDGLNVRDWLHVQDHCAPALAPQTRLARGAWRAALLRARRRQSHGDTWVSSLSSTLRHVGLPGGLVRARGSTCRPRPGRMLETSYLWREHRLT